MRNFKKWVWFLFFGSLWGISEVVLGGALFESEMPYASIWLTAWAFFVLAIGRGALNKPGSSTVIGAFAALFKLVNAAPYYCHLLGIFLLGFAFDAVSSFLMKHERKISFRSSISGAISAYGGYALFALVITYIVRYEYWTAGGSAKVLHYVFVSGSFAALMAIFLVPLGYWIGSTGEAMVRDRSKWAIAGAVVALVVLWTLGRIAG